MSQSNKESIIAEYNERQPKNGSKLTPRIGYYVIKEIKENNKHIACPIGIALWKEDAQSNFHKDVTVEVGIAALQLSSENPFAFEPDFLINKLIHVKSQVDTTIIFKGTETPFVKSEWSIETSPVVIDGAPSFFDLLGNDSPDLRKLIDQTPTNDDNGPDDDSDLFDDDDYALID